MPAYSSILLAEPVLDGGGLFGAELSEPHLTNVLLTHAGHLRLLLLEFDLDLLGDSRSLLHRVLQRLSLFPERLGETVDLGREAQLRRGRCL